ncbi:HD domain-containing protein [Robiginitalea sp. M366]|uniref:HD domain-containing protein n=1 Tax=Robiginitalea aestuariiviva TaxID=3036903 RepID=UPI00240D48D3|nr:HD domain-containing protein [Robiginitalea aestuariiviva]MDG1572028.1 HD domain-containing protein [Robiginitalea aestuariiviva]
MELENSSLYPDICHRILEDLAQKLPSYLTYHCLEHTLDVANVCNRYIDYYMVAEPVARLIRIAAVAHDYGYIYGPKDHEERSITEVRPMLTDYSEKEIALVEGLIRATKVPQYPRNLYEEILADADLDYLGRGDYEPLSDLLYKEFLHFGVVKNPEEWVQVQIRFLEGHAYHTDWAIRHRVAEKKKVLEALRAQVVTPPEKG